jgi:hypothetical protein
MYISKKKQLREKKMDKKPTTKDCIKFVCDGLDTINEAITSQKDLMHERNKIEEQRLQWEMETKDRVDIPLKKYEGMKQHIDHLTRKNYHYEEIFERLRINEIIDKIDPATVELSTMKDPMRLSTRVNIQFECKCLIEQNLNERKEMTPFERYIKRN